VNSPATHETAAVWLRPMQSADSWASLQGKPVRLLLRTGEGEDLVTSFRRVRDDIKEYSRKIIQQKLTV